MSADPLVSTEWLARHLDAPDVRVADATYFLPTMGRDARAEYDAAHIPGAVFFDIDDIADPNSDLPHMLPDAARFSSRVRRLGLGDDVRIVLYDNNKLSASARAWWMFRLFGHDDVAVLDGGLAKWRAEGRPVTDEPVVPGERHFTARTNTRLVRDLAQMRDNLISRREQVLDARPAARFRGEAPEPRPGVRKGHIPASLSLPFTDLLDPEHGTMLEPAALRSHLAGEGVELDRPIVTTCGSGVTAATVALALYRLGVEDAAVYDGSWSEWGAHPDTPVET